MEPETVLGWFMVISLIIAMSLFLFMIAASVYKGFFGD